MPLFLLIHRFHRRYMTKLTSLLAPYELTPANWSLLHYLHINEMVTTSKLAQYWDVEKPTVSANVKALIQRGLIEATPGEDKREKKLMLTNSGKEYHDNIFPQIQSMQQALLSDIPEETRIQFEQFLLSMEATLKEEFK